MSGFVYIWYDRKHKRFYVGSHWGTPDDGYICSSKWMKRNYERRPQDFKRRILAYRDNRVSLVEEEFRWITMIKPEESGTRYYNLRLFATTKAQYVKEHRGKYVRRNPYPKNRKSSPRPQSVRDKISKSLQGHVGVIHNDDVKRKIAESSVRHHSDPDVKKKHSEAIKKSWEKRKSLV